MKKYSITKYERRNITGQEEWTAISDIGKAYNGIILSVQAYKKVEDAYVNAILEIMEYMHIEYLWIKNVFRWKDLKKDIQVHKELKGLYTDAMLKIYEEVQEGQRLDREHVSDLIRLELREDIGGFLYMPYRLKVFIGYDYLMGVHTSMALENLFERITKLGLNIYQFI